MEMRGGEGSRERGTSCYAESGPGGGGICVHSYPDPTLHLIEWAVWITFHPLSCTTGSIPPIVIRPPLHCLFSLSYSACVHLQKPSVCTGTDMVPSKFDTRLLIQCHACWKRSVWIHTPSTYDGQGFSSPFRQVSERQSDTTQPVPDQSRFNSPVTHHPSVTRYEINQRINVGTFGQVCTNHQLLRHCWLQLLHRAFLSVTT